MIDLLQHLLYFLLTLTILVVFHEYGHYKVAKLCGVRVIDFSIGFGPKLVSWYYNKTLFSFSLLPFGGYVRMLDKDTMTSQDAPNQNYHNKTTIQKIAILFAGPLFNFILALLVFSAIAMLGKNVLLPVVDRPYPNSIAEQIGIAKGVAIVAVDGVAIDSLQQLQMQLLQRVGDSGAIELAWNNSDGQIMTETIPINRWLRGSVQPEVLQNLGLSINREDRPLIIESIQNGSAADASQLMVGDEILMINGQSVVNWSYFSFIVANSAAEQIDLLVKRDQSIQNISIIPRLEMREGVAVGLIGITFQPEPIPNSQWLLQRDSLFGSLITGVKDTWNGIIFTMSAIVKVISGAISFKAMGGPISIAQYATDSASYGLVPYLHLLALLSISLGMINLLPIPVLDGGRIVICLIEAASGRSFSDEIIKYVHLVGFLLIIFVTITVIYNDLLRIQ